MKPKPKWIAAISPSKRASRAAYNREAKKFLVGKRCAVFTTMRATQVHHIRGRLGPLLMDQRYWLPVSQLAHDRIHANPEWARSNGWMAKRGQWNCTPRTKNLFRKQP